MRFHPLLRKIALAGVLAGVLTGVLALTPPTHAAEPARGSVTGSVTVTASRAVVLDLLADHTETLRMCPDVRSVRVVSTSAQGCAELAVETTGLWNPMHYVSRRCPTADGSREELLHSDDFYENTFVWSVTDAGSVRRVSLVVRSAPRLPVPEWILGPAVRSSVDTTLANFAARVAARVTATATQAPR